MKKTIIAVLFLIPSIATAATFVKDSYTATLTTATSSFAGNFSVAGNVQFSGFGDGILSMFNGLLSAVTVQAPLTFSNNILGISAAGSDGDIQFNSSGSFAGDSSLRWDVSEGGPTTLLLGGPPEGVIIKARDRLLIIGEDVESAGEIALQAGQTEPGVSGALVELQGGQLNLAAGNATGSGIPGGVEIKSGFNSDNSASRGKIVLFSQGNIGTTTIEFGRMGQPEDHVCFNTKNTDGQDISFYFVGTTMMVENNLCR